MDKQSMARTSAEIKASALRACGVGVIVLLALTCDQARASEQEALPVAMTLYGKVVDSHGEAVAGAIVHVQICSTTGTKERPVDKLELVTDADGGFEIEADGTSLVIKDIKKNGYEFLRPGPEETHFVYVDTGGDRIHVPDPAEPVVFTMRRKAEPALLLRASRKILFKPDDASTYSIDICAPDMRDRSGFVKAEKKQKADLQVSSSLSADKSVYRLLLRIMGEENGLIAGDELLHEAPSAGYQSNVTIEAPVQSEYQETEKHVFVKTMKGNQVQFSRLDLRLVAGQGGLVIVMDSWTNPDGSRNLEYDEKFQVEELKRRIAQSTKASEKMLFRDEVAKHTRRDWDFAAQRRRTQEEQRQLRKVVEGKQRQRTEPEN